MPEASAPSEGDWIKIQGGEPKLIKHDDSGIIEIVHDYPTGNGMIVPTSPFSYQQFGTIDFLIDGRRVRFDVAKLRRFHGEPCEIRSKAVGGQSYSRIK